MDPNKAEKVNKWKKLKSSMKTLLAISLGVIVYKLFNPDKEIGGKITLDYCLEMADGINKTLPIKVSEIESITRVVCLNGSSKHGVIMRYEYTWKGITPEMYKLALAQSNLRETAKNRICTEPQIVKTNQWLEATTIAHLNDKGVFLGEITVSPESCKN